MIEKKKKKSSKRKRKNNIYIKLKKLFTNHKTYVIIVLSKHKQIQIFLRGGFKMKVENIKGYEVVEYDSLNEFYKYICDTPFNESFRWVKHESVANDYSFTQTRSFEEATDLLKNGWTDMSGKLTQRLNVVKNQVQPTMKPKTINSVAGFQPIVPLYLSGVPTNMVNRKMVPVKQKVITLTKSISYSCGIKTEQIVEESVKAMMIVKKLEAQGYRVNLNVMMGGIERGLKLITKIRIKSAGEKLNISKLAFPLVHPSMLRRLMFRFIEVYPKVTKSFVNGYGSPVHDDEAYNLFKDSGEYLLPAFIKKDVSTINTIDDLANI